MRRLGLLGELKDLIFVSGKGGTGKSTLAASLARQLARQGKRTLLVELERQSSVRALLATESEPQYGPSPSGFGFDWSLVTGRDCLVEYVTSFTRLESLTQKFFESTLLRTLVDVAPGLNDLSILGKLTSRVRGHGPAFEYDHVVVDAPSTGSFQSLVEAPRTLGQSVKRGPLHKQSFAIDEVLQNPEVCQFFFVSLFEELPVDELEDTLAHFHENYAEQVTVIMNKAFPLNSTATTEGSWGRFVSQRVEEMEKQKKRVQELWPRVYSLPFFTKPFAEFLADYDGEDLRPL